MAQLFCVSCEKADAHFFVMAENKREANYVVYDAIMNDEDMQVSSFNRVKKCFNRLKNGRVSLLRLLSAEPMVAVGNSEPPVYDLWEEED